MTNTKRVLALVLAGGKGERLDPLTRDRAKPAVPFGGVYRIVDFTLSNCINSNIRRIILPIQYKCASLNRHLRDGWTFLSSALGEFIEPIPPQQRIGDQWYSGTADAVYQNLYEVEKHEPDLVLILAGDHIYKMDYSQMIRFHRERNADVTVAAVEVPRKEASGFGVVATDEEHRIRGFLEKPEDPPAIPGQPDLAFASMGIYVFNAKFLTDALEADAADEKSSHDFGRNILPKVIHTHRVFAFAFADENKKAAKYWRDVGTIDAYYQANMDLIAVSPEFNLYDPEWPIRTYQPQAPPPKFVFAQEYPGGRLGIALDSLVSPGCIVSGGRVQNSILSPNVRINSYAEVKESILFERVTVGRHARIRRAIVDKDVTIPEGMEIGFDLEADARRFVVSDGGIVVISKGAQL